MEIYAATRNMAIPNEVRTLSELVRNVAIRTAIQKVPLEIWKLSDYELEKLACPTPLLSTLKEKFWNVYFATLLSKKGMKLAQVYEAKCSYTYFYNGILRDSARLVWLLRLSADHDKRLEGHLDLVLPRIREILTISPINSNGTLNHRLAKLQIRIFERLSEVRAFESMRVK